MLIAILNIAFLLLIGVLGLVASGGVPGGNAQLRESATQVAAKVAPFAGIIGIVAVVWGLWGFINLLMYLGTLLRFAPVSTILGLVTVVVLVGLGLIMAYPLLAQAMASGGGREALDNALAKVKPYQRPLALTAVALAVINFVLLLLSFMSVRL